MTRASAYQTVVAVSVAVIHARPEGARYGDLVDAVMAEAPDMNRNTLQGSLNRFRNNLPGGIIRPARGLFITKEAWAKRDKKKRIPYRVDKHR